ncbi:hypothetical protein INS49_007350 [Diaporthe citri]|uniref:uncharacterized protein n=1 Tax=Diaporthe citri TaxID=83186 RepID=UPI001C7F0A70|nr:uncharacterized protein INS49_007350 [Diaporthe citri]KAG6365739.1 hypothetical protein INS49_007350 [Diaporthe citri]
MAEPKVPKGSLPSGYSFVPKGNVYITSNCRKLTQAGGSPVYIVIDAKNHQIGLGIPTETYVGVQFKEMETRADRAANVLKRDEGIAKGFQKEIMNIFPQIPSKALQNVLKIALEKGKGKVGRTGKLDIQRKAHLAVWAHIRHCETGYDALLRNGIPREDARKQVEEKIKEVRKAWGGDSQMMRGKPGKSSRSLARANIKSTQAAEGARKDSPGHLKKSVKTASLTTAITSAASPRASKMAGHLTNERNAAVRNARRAHRRKKSLDELTKGGTKPAKQQEAAAPKTASPKVVATAASFREKRTPKPTVIEPAAPSPHKGKARRVDPTMPNLDHESRAQISRLITRVDRIERAHRTGRRRQRQRHVTTLCTMASLNNQINRILADASIQAIEPSTAARKDLSRRLRRKVRASEGSS